MVLEGLENVLSYTPSLLDCGSVLSCERMLLLSLYFYVEKKHKIQTAGRLSVGWFVPCVIQSMLRIYDHFEQQIVVPNFLGRWIHIGLLVFFKMAGVFIEYGRDKKQVHKAHPQCRLHSVRTHLHRMCISE